MDAVFEKLAELAELRKLAEPGPWEHRADWCPYLITRPDKRPAFSDDSCVVAQEPDTRLETNWSANAAFIAAAGSIDFAAVHAALAAAEAAAPLADAELAELAGLLLHITALPWMHHKDEDEDEPHAVVQFPGYGTQVGLRYIAETQTDDVEAEANTAYMVAASNALPGLLARLAAAEAAAPPLAAAGGGSFQPRVATWMQETFGAEVSADYKERGFRFGEEAIELLQANGTTKEDVLKLVDYVYGRPVGELQQEVGGAMVTLAALCEARGIDLAEAGNTEITRCESPEVRAKIQAKQEAKRARMIATPLSGDPSAIIKYEGPADEPGFVPPAFEMSEQAIEHWFGKDVHPAPPTQQPARAPHAH